MGASISKNLNFVRRDVGHTRHQVSFSATVKIKISKIKYTPRHVSYYGCVPATILVSAFNIHGPFHLCYR